MRCFTLFAVFACLLALAWSAAVDDLLEVDTGVEPTDEISREARQFGRGGYGGFRGGYGGGRGGYGGGRGGYGGGRGGYGGGFGGNRGGYGGRYGGYGGRRNGGYRGGFYG